jgi:hypothetical protein
MTDSIARRLFPHMTSVAAAAPPVTTSAVSPATSTAPLAHRLFPNMPRIPAPVRPALRYIAHNASPAPASARCCTALGTRAESWSTSRRESEMLEGLATPTYRSLIAEVERQRERRGWPIWKLEQVAGLSEAHISKLLRGERLGTWQTLEFLIAAMFPKGHRIRIEPLKPMKIAPASIPEHHHKILTAYNRHLLATVASSGGHARAEKLTRKRRQEIGKLGAQARWGHKRKLAPHTANGNRVNGNRAVGLPQPPAFD